jgi:hypothetical protein
MSPPEESVSPKEALGFGLIGYDFNNILKAFSLTKGEE